MQRNLFRGCGAQLLGMYLTDLGARLATWAAQFAELAAVGGGGGGGGEEIGTWARFGEMKWGGEGKCGRHGGMAAGDALSIERASHSSALHAGPPLHDRILIGKRWAVGYQCCPVLAPVASNTQLQRRVASLRDQQCYQASRTCRKTCLLEVVACRMRRGPGSDCKTVGGDA